MENKPGIATAIPKRRYSFGEFTVTFLGEIESNDGVAYRYIAAVIHGRNPEPGLYITAEKDASGELAMRLVMQDGSEVLEHAGRWQDLDIFSDEVLGIVANLLKLSDEVPYRLM